MQDLQAAAEVIESQLALANNLAWSIDMSAHNGQIVESGTIDAATIDQQMVTAYNNAINNVLNTSYLTAADILADEHQNAINNMHTAIDDLVAATAVLQTVSAVADMAESANTTQDQLQVQAALATTDMSIDQSDVDNYNTALSDVETYAQQAGAFLAASNNSDITATIDSYAASNNVAVASYTAVSYTQSIDTFIIEFGTDAYIQFTGTFTSNTKSAEEIYGSVGYSG